ncbi:SDR family NAD(P)-dependent oxidoreductase [Mesorhizobium sp. INR15]|uniref:SDR family NAD(P)-dependent oxidoreductase n=1 Tax=Mesorhizobium sp. INR15 TaxID=2654248 RepID=UPI0018969A47|nr:SDR family oxidoreductase [Mesorhizobium sp. INR15]
MFTGQRVILTGPDGTIGSAIKLRLENQGAEVATIGHQPGLGGYVADFTDEGSLQAAVAVAAADGPMHGLVFAHGLLLPGTIDVVTPAEWRRMLAVNVDSIYTIIHHALPRLAAGASIVAISSTAGFDHSPVGGPHYTASKWALNGLVRHLAFDLGPRGVRINSVCPGTVEGPMARALLSTEAYQESLKAIPLGRAADADEIAEVVQFLIEPRSRYVTGTNIPVAGGYR